jgi:hypothetical protein
MVFAGIELVDEESNVSKDTQTWFEDVRNGQRSRDREQGTHCCVAGTMEDDEVRCGGRRRGVEVSIRSK